MTRIVRKCAGSLAVAAGLFVFQACDNGTVEPESLTGTWSYSVSNLNGGGQSCSVAGGTINFTQSGTQLTGSTTGGTLTCTSGNSALPNSTITNGSVNGTAVQFGFSGVPAQHTGTITGGEIKGTVTVLFPIGGGLATLSGQFTATRQ
jgi:hypothetical protein